MRERIADARAWLKRKLCRHDALSDYEEARVDLALGKVSWSAFYACPRCGEVLQVVASFYGRPEVIAEAIKGEEGKP